MRLTFDNPAPEHTLFTEEGLPSVGYRMPVHLPDGTETTGTLTEIRLLAGGAAARCTVEVDEATTDSLLGGMPLQARGTGGIGLAVSMEP